MTNKVCNFLNKYKSHLVVIIILIIVLIFIYKIIYRKNPYEKVYINNDMNEHLENITQVENTPSISSNNSIDNKVGKNVYFKYDKAERTRNDYTIELIPYYISIIPNNLCNNNDIFDKCKNNMAVLNDKKNLFTKFQLNKNSTRGEFSYELVSEVGNNTQLNYMDNSLKLCFDNSESANARFFALEQNSYGKYIMKFKKDTIGSNEILQSTYYYLTECDENYRCLQNISNYRRLCLTDDPNRAISFDIELDEDIGLSPEEISLYSLDEKDENKSVSNVESFIPDMNYELWI